MAEFEKKVEEVKDTVAKKAEELNEDFKASEVGKKVLGEDGKFDKEDVDRIAAKAKETGKGVVDYVKGEDGKFDKEDITRIADDAVEAGKKVVDKVKDLFDKK